MAIEKWVGGNQSTFASLFGTEINSLANGNAVLSSVAISNPFAADIFLDLDFIAGATTTTAAPNTLGFYLYPLLHDGATYGDGRFASAASGAAMPGERWKGNITCPIGAGTTVEGYIERIVIPPGTFKFVLLNNTGAALAASCACKYLTYNRQTA